MTKGLIVILKYIVLPILILVGSVYLLLGVFIHFPKYAIIGIVSLILFGIWRYLSVRRINLQRGWRVQASGRDTFCYAELRSGKWEGIQIDGEMCFGTPGHIIYTGSLEKCENYPEWARNRKDEILSRIKSQLREPKYKYLGEFYQYDWKGADFNGIRVYVGKPPSQCIYKSVGLISTEVQAKNFDIMVKNIISSSTLKASNMGANAIINWHIKGAGLNKIKGEGESVTFEAYPCEKDYE